MKGGNQISPVCNIILHIEKLKYSTKKPLVLTNSIKLYDTKLYKNQ
jgi:hypothetical protein